MQLFVADHLARARLDQVIRYFDEQVHFPDFRIEYELGGRDRYDDVEVMTEHYRGAFAASEGHANITTTSRYLRSTPTRLQRLARIFEEHRKIATRLPHEDDRANVDAPFADAANDRKPLIVN